MLTLNVRYHDPYILKSTTVDDNLHFLDFSINHKIFIRLFHTGSPSYIERWNMVLMTNGRDFVWKIDIMSCEIIPFISDWYITDILFYKSFIIVVDELSIQVLDENMKMIISKAGSDIIKNAIIEDGVVYYTDENNYTAMIDLNYL